MQKATLTAASVASHFEIECLLLLSRLMLPYSARSKPGLFL